MKESPIVREIRLGLGSMDGIVLWRNNVGAWEDARGNWTEYGLCKGSSDLVGIVTCGNTGRFFALEVKAPGARTQPARKAMQLLFRTQVNARGGYAAQVTSYAEALAHFKACQDGRQL